MGEIHRQACLRQLHPHRLLDRRISSTEQDPQRRRLAFRVDPAADGVIPYRQIQEKDRATTGGIFEASLTAEALDDLFDNTQTKSGSALLPGIAGIRLSELLEEVRFEFARYARTMVAHRNAEIVTVIFDGDAHGSARGREFDGI